MKSVSVSMSSLACLLLALPGAADEVPAGASIPSSYDITKTYVGRTEIWDEGCSGGIYYGPNGQARAWCGENSSGFAAGYWSADASGRMCHQLTWYFIADGKVGSSLGERACTSHLLDERRKVWRNWPGSDEWWPAENDSLVRGYRFQNEILAVRRLMGL